MREGAPSLPPPPRHCPSDMETDRFRDNDREEFLRLAAEEGWISDRWELEFLRRSFPQGCLVKRRQELPAAFVTALSHDRSGWIGNLLVHPELRRKGTGAQLLAGALSALEAAGVVTVWLTASESGKALYQRLGFREIDRIERWIGGGFAVTMPPERHEISKVLKELDRAGWGDRRELLLTSLAEEGEMTVGEDAFLMTRKIAGMRQIGPWGGNSQRAIDLFQRHLTPDRGDERICLDVPWKNRLIGRFLEQQGMKKSGSTILMYRGESPAYRPELIGACASMGSMG